MSKTETKKEKLKTDGRVICTSCKEFSGWINDDLVHVKTGRSLKCKQCGDVCIRVMDKNDMHNLEREREEALIEFNHLKYIENKILIRN